MEGGARILISKGGAKILICKGRAPSVNPNLVRLFALFWSKILYTIVHHYISPVLWLSGSCPFYFAGIQTTTTKIYPTHHLTTGIFCISVILPLEGSWHRHLKIFPYTTALVFSHQLFFFSAFIKSSKINTKDPCNYCLKKGRQRERLELEFAFWYLNQEGSHFQNFLYLERR